MILNNFSGSFLHLGHTPRGVARNRRFSVPLQHRRRPPPARRESRLFRVRRSMVSSLGSSAERLARGMTVPRTPFSSGTRPTSQGLCQGVPVFRKAHYLMAGRAENRDIPSRGRWQPAEAALCRHEGPSSNCRLNPPKLESRLRDAQHSPAFNSRIDPAQEAIVPVCQPVQLR